MKAIPFTKLSGAGNDFILIEAPHRRSTLSWPTLARRLCPRRVAVGADGLLVARRQGKGGIPEMDYYNADGSRAFCGNGLRCAAWWMHQMGWVGRRFSMGSMQGPIVCEIMSRERARTAMPEARGLRLGLRLKAAGRAYLVSAIDTGVPHAIARVNKLEKFAVVETGRALRWSKAFASAGANVNFVEINKTRTSVRTYERGVEDETLACGTGAVASAILTFVWTGRKSPITVQSRGGMLKVGFTSRSKGRFSDVWLEGPARITYHGEAVV